MHGSTNIEDIPFLLDCMKHVAIVHTIGPIDLRHPSSAPHFKTFVSHKSEYCTYNSTRLKVVKSLNAVFFIMKSSDLTDLPFGQATIQSVGDYNLFCVLRI